MLLTTKHFGEIAIVEEKKISFPEGILGLEALKSFILIEEEESIFYYLQSITEPTIAFAIVNPYSIMQDYAPIINESYFDKLGGGETEVFGIYSIVTVGENLEDTTLNLQGPLIIHMDNKIGIQAIVDGNQYHTKHKMVELLERGVPKC